jgi:antitoxin component YwqK of YwqJK toxin-antitoxin module
MSHRCLASVAFVIVALLSFAAAFPAADPPDSKPDLTKPLGSAENPVRCEGVRGEHRYLHRLRGPDGKKPEFSRIGSFGGGGYGNIIDGYTVSHGGKDITVFIDMYHSGYVENTPVEGFDMVSQYTDQLYVRGLIHTKPGENKPFTGDIVEKHESGEKKLEFSVKEGLITGKLVWYYVNGKVQSVTPFEKGLRHGDFVDYFEDGSESARGTYKDGQTQGKVVVLHPNGKTRREMNFKDGLHHGPYAEYDEQGRKLVEGMLKNGMRDGRVDQVRR